MKNIALGGLLLWSNILFASPELDEAKALLDAMNAKEQYRVVAAQAQSQLGLETEEFLKFSDKIYEEMAIIYAEVYTLEELKGIKAFYESDAGKAFQNKKPLLTEKYIGVVSRMVSDFVE